MKEKIILGESNAFDPDGNKHNWIQYKYKDYIFNKEWYMNIENEYVMGLTLFKLGEKNTNKFAPPTIEYEGKYYNEIFHSGNCKDVQDDDLIFLIEKIILKDKYYKGEIIKGIC